MSCDTTDIYIDLLAVSGGILNITTLAGTGTGETLVNDGLGNDLVTKDLIAGIGITLTSTADDITIAAIPGTLQGAYDASGAPPHITLTAANGPLTVQDNAVPTGGNLFQVNDSGAATTVFAVDATSVTVDGKLNVTGAIDPTALILNEQPAIPIPPAPGTGTLWVQNTVPTTLVFADDTGAEVLLNGDVPGVPAGEILYGNGTGTGTESDANFRYVEGVGQNGLLIGDTNNYVSGTNSIVYGENNIVDANNCFVGGTLNNVTGDRAFVSGGSNTVSGAGARCLGIQSVAGGIESTTIGRFAIANGINSLVIGPGELTAGAINGILISATGSTTGIVEGANARERQIFYSQNQGGYNQGHRMISGNIGSELEVSTVDHNGTSLTWSYVPTTPTNWVNSGLTTPGNIGDGLDELATFAESTSSTLSEIESGTWTPLYIPGGGANTFQGGLGSSVTARYQKIGAICTIHAQMTINNATVQGNEHILFLQTASLPFAPTGTVVSCVANGFIISAGIPSEILVGETSFLGALSSITYRSFGIAGPVVRDANINFILTYTTII